MSGRRTRTVIGIAALGIWLTGLAAGLSGTAAVAHGLQSSATLPTTQATQPVRLGPIHVEEIRQEVDGQPIRGWAAKVNLRDPRVEIRVTAPIEKRTDDPLGLEARTETTPDWLQRQGLTLAVNTHFFARLDDGKGPVPTSAPVDLIGPCISAGRVVSPGRKDGKPSPVLAFTRNSRARLAMLAPGELDGAYNAVSGVSESGGKAGGLLVENGKNIGHSALVAPTVRHPRTAAGLTADGRTLILVVIDGRQPAWSIGMTLPELADLMIRLGAESAVNLDGGGSSSFVYVAPDGQQLTNRPSDGRWRPVGASLGVYLHPTP